MQFLERSVLGLRSARHVLKSPEQDHEITLFPMIHVGEASFYEKVEAGLMDMDVVLLEGVDSNTARRLTRVYRWLALRRLGLVVQPRLGPRLERAGVRVVHADMSAQEFDAAWAELPLVLRLCLPILTTGVAIWRRFAATRATLAERVETTDLPDRARLLSQGGPLDPMDTLIRDQRDAILLEALKATLRANAGRTVRVGVVFGAAHMAALVKGLTGFAPVQSDWMTVFEL